MNRPLDIRSPGSARPARPIRLIALDLDGTCLDTEQRLNPRIRDAVRVTAEAGVTVVVATGRMYRSALPWAYELGVTAPLICYQGALVRAVPTADSPVVCGHAQGELVAEHAVESATALCALHEARLHNWHFQAYQDDELLCEQDRPEARLYARIAQITPTFVDDLEPLLQAGSTKVVCVVEDPEEAQECEDRMSGLLGKSARVMRSRPEFVEIINPRASKRLALEGLCTRLGIDMADTGAVGDAPNDVDMLAGAAFAVAVETEDRRLLDVADALCAGPEDGGVADVLEAVITSRRPD